MFPAEPHTDDGQQVDGQQVGDGQERPGAPASSRQRGGPPVSSTLVLSAPPGSPDETVVAAHGEIDGCTAPALLSGLIDALHTADGRTLVVDLRGVSFMGACGITVLVAVRADALALGIPLAVVADHRAVLRPLQITTLADELAVRATAADIRRGTAPRQDRSATVDRGHPT